MNWLKERLLSFTIKCVYKRRFHMRSWKTSLFGVISAISLILPYFGVPQDVSTAIQTVSIFLFGLFAKDSNVSGTKP